MNKLNQLHLDDLRKSGLNDETITKSGIESVHLLDFESEIGMKFYNLESVYRIPFDADYCRYKLFFSCDAPPAKRPKYSQKKGSNNRLYFPAAATEASLKGKEPLYITEGEKKAIKACQEGMLCVGITGLWNWKIKGTDELISDFNKINLVGRAIIIVPDNDWLDLSKEGKPRHLDDAVYRLATALMLRGANVKITHLPKSGSDKVGLDDYLINHTVDDFKKIHHETHQVSPCYRIEKGYLNYYGIMRDEDNSVSYEDPIKICSALEIVAYTRNGKNEEWGRMLSFYDKDHILHTWAMPMELLSGDGIDLRRELYRRGLPYIISGKHKAKLLDYLQITVPVDGKRARCIDRTGWYGDNIFILPNRVIGNTNDEPVVFQGSSETVVSQKGSLNEWKKNVARYCIGNSRLIFAVSMAFTAPLLHLIDAENIGINFFGNSSTGKTTALRIACSVWGNKDYMLRWRATGNGLEGVATAHNDLFVGLDELAQVSPIEAGEIAYMLANGAGKSRAGRDGEARQTKRWRTCFLSTGEITLADHVQSSGKKVKAGQEVRLLDIPADTGKHGVFEELHEMENGNQLSCYLNKIVADYYGCAGIAFIEQTLETYSEIPETIKTIRDEFISNNLPPGSDSQVQRVVSFFGLIAAAGEFATMYNLTGWNKGDAEEAAKKCFAAWIDQRGGIGAREADRIIEDVRLFIEQHGSSRFVDSEGDADRVVTNRAGYRNDTIFYILPEVFKKEVLKGHNFKLAKNVLVSHKILVPDIAASRTDRSFRPNGEASIRVYAIDGAVLLGAGN